MDWLMFALLSPLMFAVGNIFDKFILTKKIRDSFSYNILGESLSILPIIFLVFYLKLNFDIQALTATLYGFVFSFLFIVYNKAMMKGEASRLISVMRISPVFVLTLSFIFLNEILSYQRYLGILFLVSSAVLVSYKRSKKKFQLSGGVAMILLYTFSAACLSIVMKYTLGQIDFWAFFFWNIVGNMIGCLTLLALPTIRNNLIKNVSSMGKGTWLTVLSADIFSWLGYLFYFIAASIGYISLTSAVGSIQPLIVFMLTLALTIHRPKVLKEEISRTSLLFKSIAVVLIIIGGYLIVI